MGWIPQPHIVETETSRPHVKSSVSLQKMPSLEGEARLHRPTCSSQEGRIVGNGIGALESYEMLVR
jgi:hypothetical protein